MDSQSTSSASGGLLAEFQNARFKSTRCVVCYEVSPEVREVIEDGIRRGIGPVSTMKFLRDRGLWHWSESPIVSHARHPK